MFGLASRESKASRPCHACFIASVPRLCHACATLPHLIAKILPVRILGGSALLHAPAHARLDKGKVGQRQDNFSCEKRHTKTRDAKTRDKHTASSRVIIQTRTRHLLESSSRVMFSSHKRGRTGDQESVIATPTKNRDIERMLGEGNDVAGCCASLLPCPRPKANCLIEGARC